jgi:hypothetical protein
MSSSSSALVLASGSMSGTDLTRPIGLTGLATFPRLIDRIAFTLAMKSGA